MRIDCAFESPEAATADIAIVGSGAAGQAAARRALARGCSVLLIESGGIDYEAASADLNRGEVIGQHYHPLDHSRLRFFGGTTAIWGGRCAELDDIDFERRDWVDHSGWPIGPEDIAPYVAEARQLLGVDSVGPQELGKRPPLDLLSARELHVRWWTFDPLFDRFTVDRAGDLENHPRCTIIVHATVREVMLSKDSGAVDRLDVRTPEGKRIDIRARHYILAAGGIENPRILLNSTSVAAKGVGNDHDLVGRFFMEHPHGRGGRIVGGADWRWLGAFARRRIGEIEVSPTLTPSTDLQRRDGLLNSSVTVAVRPPADGNHALPKRAYLHVKHRTAPTRSGRGLWKATRRAVRAYTEVAGALHPWLLKRVRGLDLALVIRAEQAPNPDSRVLLGDEVDATGMRRVALDWRLSTIDVESIAGLVGALGREARRLGMGSVEPAEWLSDPARQWVTDDLISAHPIGGFHHMGTTRMASDPRRGVTDGWGRVHGVHNLHIAGSSLFPTGGWANPTLTLLALALRTTDRVADEIQSAASASGISRKDALGTTG